MLDNALEDGKEIFDQLSILRSSVICSNRLKIPELPNAGRERKATKQAYRKASVDTKQAQLMTALTESVHGRYRFRTSPCFNALDLQQRAMLQTYRSISSIVVVVTGLASIVREAVWQLAVPKNIVRKDDDTQLTRLGNMGAC